jgi:diguanylate cyclase
MENMDPSRLVVVIQMKSTKQPSEIAREALRLLSARKLSPTPANYQDCYYEIAQTPHMQGFPEDQLRQIALALTAQNEAQQKQLNQLDIAISKHSWKGVGEALKALFQLGVCPDLNDMTSEPRPVVDEVRMSARDFLTKFASLIESVRPALVGDDEGFAEQFAGLLLLLRDPQADIQVARNELELFSQRLAFAAEQQAEIKQALLKLLHHRERQQIDCGGHLVGGPNRRAIGCDASPSKPAPTG